MTATNYSDVLHQLQDFGLLIPPAEGLRIGTHKPVRVFTQDGGREKRGWYLLKEWSPSADRLLIVGSFGIWRGNEKHAQKIALPKDDTGRVTPEQRAAMRRVWEDAARAAELQRKQEAEAAANRASKAWARLLPDGDSPYLAAKGVIGYGLKFTEHGTAVVPLTDTGARIHGLQFLRTPQQAKEGRRPVKEFWPPGIAKKGHFHLIGHQPHWIVLVAEGYATAATLHAATGYPVAVAFDAGNLKPVAEALRQRYKQAKVLVCADDDILGKCIDPKCKARIALPVHPVDCPACGKPHGYTNAGVESASAAAMEARGEWVMPRFTDQAARIAKWLDGKGKDSDFNDLHALEGLSAIGAQVSARLTELHWDPPQLRAVPSLQPGGRGAKLKPIQFLEDLLKRFAYVYGSSEAVFDRQEHVLVKLTDMRNLCIRSDLHKAWMEHPDRDVVRLEEIGFDPACEDPNITCNLWAGWPTDAKEGECQRLLDHLYYLCSAERNAREVYDWVLKWLAYPLQHPGAKMRSTVVLHGGQGTGKNVIFEAVMRIYGIYGRILGQDALDDKHNDWASRKLFLIADEVVAQANRFDLKNKLKTFVTGTQVRINPKHIAAYDEANHVNLVFLSNEKMPVVLEEDDRRHCIIWTPPAREDAYYIALAKEMEDGGIAALHHHLLNLDLSKFNEHSKPPLTESKEDLIELALDTPEAFADALLSGDLLPLRAMPGRTLDWYALYQHWCTRVGQPAASMKRFVNSLKHKRRFRSERKCWRQFDGTIGNAIAVLTFGNTAPAGQTDADWLAAQIETFDKIRQDYKNGVVIPGRGGP